MAVMRSVLIALSKNRTLRDLIVRVPVSRRMARRFVPGETLDDAVAAVRTLNEQGMVASLDHLGENVATQAEAVAAADEYLVALDALFASKARGNISVKLTQMGLDLGDDFCFDNVSRIAAKAAELGTFVRVDMEGSPYTERTIGIYRRLRGRFSNVGIVIQAYLHRSQADVESLVAEGMGNFRLCKGAYDEPAAIAYRERPRVTQALNELVRTCMEPAGRAKGAYAAVASHDTEVINFARAPMPTSTTSRRRPTNSRCSTASAGSCRLSWRAAAIPCASMSPTARTGIPTTCAAWPSGRRTSSSSSRRS